EVPPEAFDPPPRVDSAVVRMQPLPRVAAVGAALLEALVAAPLSPRRQLLRPSLGRRLAARALNGRLAPPRRGGGGAVGGEVGRAVAAAAPQASGVRGAPR